MSAPANAVSGSRPAAAANLPWLRSFYWSVRRELWEYRSIYLAPLAAAGLILVGFAFRLADLPNRLRMAQGLDAAHRAEVIEGPFTFAALLLMLATILVAVFYCLDALYGERRDRSVLFWKSLPVSDTTTVLAKATIPMVVIPLVTFAVTAATQAVMLMMAAVRLSGTGLSVWSQLSFWEMSGILFYHLLLGHGMWYAPFWGWMLLCSAWSRRAPLLWATLPLLALGLVEKIAFNTEYFGRWIEYRFLGSPHTVAPSHPRMTMAGITPATFFGFLSSPSFWFGLGLCAVFLAGAVRLRRQSGPA
jgi:ABC-2 type transport system permease protein